MKSTEQLLELKDTQVESRFSRIANNLVRQKVNPKQTNTDWITDPRMNYH